MVHPVSSSPGPRRGFCFWTKRGRAGRSKAHAARFSSGILTSEIGWTEPPLPKWSRPALEEGRPFHSWQWEDSWTCTAAERRRFVPRPT